MASEKIERIKKVLAAEPESDMLWFSLGQAYLAEESAGSSELAVEAFEKAIALKPEIKLLTLLENKVVRRLGSVRDHKANVRIITATNKPLEQMVKDGRFRSDLFFRLRIVQLRVPALRERGLLFVGIDVIDGYLTEINVTSPTGIRAIKNLGGSDVAALIWDTIEAKRKLR